MSPRPLRWLALPVLLLLGGALGAWADLGDRPGALAEGARRARVEASAQWSDGRFRNVLPRVDGPWGQMLRRWVFGGSPDATPRERPPYLRRSGAEFGRPPLSGLRVTWLGHSTLLLEIDGQNVLLDPVWGERASPFSFMGPKRWYPPPLPLDELPAIDVVLISHDHYDHLDTPTVKALRGKVGRWAVPLGIGAHLERWGVAPEAIVELDWWEQTRVGALTLTATPARHFSGRWLDDADQTLWSGWVMASDRHKVYYSGDTALFDEIDQIARLGPFDLTLIEAGAYDALWADVHLGPEQAVEAHQRVGGGMLLPVHWGLFDLALHAWTEPMERILAAADAAGVQVAAPRPGESIEPALARPVERWWPDVPWKRAEEAPVRSSGLRPRPVRGEPPIVP